MRAVLVVAAVSTSLFAVAATSPTSASADEIDSARARLSELRANLEDVTDRYVAAQSRLAQLNEVIDMRVGQVEERARTLLGFQKDAEEVAVELYMGGSSVSALESVLAAKSFVDMNRTTAYLEFTGENQQRVIERVTRDAAELDHELDLLDEERVQAQETLEELQDLQAAVEADSASVQDEIARLEADAAAEARAAEIAAEREAAEEAAAAATETIVQNPPPPPTAPPPPPPSSEADWYAIAQCESGGNWHIDSTYDGGLQFHPNTWLGYGGGQYARYAWQATPEQQIAIAEKVLAGQGPGAWPNCFVWK